MKQNNKKVETKLNVGQTEEVKEAKVVVEETENNEVENNEEISEVKEELDEKAKLKQEKKENAKILFKLFLVPLNIIAVTFVLFFSFLALDLNFKSHFIVPTKQGLYGQVENEYLVATYLRSDKTSIEFISNLKKAAKELDCGWYLVDIEKYPRIIQEWNITKSPTYHLINRAEQKLIYASYGNKHYTALAEEVRNVKRFGMPQNDIGSSEKFGSNVEITLKNVENNKDEKFKKVVFEINNSKSEDLIIRENDIVAKYSNFKGENIDYEYKYKGDDFENITVKAGAKKEITLYYNIGEMKHFQVEFKITLEGTTKSFFYKLWHNE